jgi:hypothetical protein
VVIYGIRSSYRAGVGSPLGAFVSEEVLCGVVWSSSNTSCSNVIIIIIIISSSSSSLVQKHYIVSFSTEVLLVSLVFQFRLVGGASSDYLRLIFYIISISLQVLVCRSATAHHLCEEFYGLQCITSKLSQDKATE